MTHYECLGLQPNATPDEIKQAYYKLAKETYPDKAPDKLEQFHAIQAAYEILGDPGKRQAYDDSLQNLDAISCQRQSFPINRRYHLQKQPELFNHYAFVNRLFMVKREDEEYLIPGQAINQWDKTRLFYQLDRVSYKLYYSEILPLEQKYHKTEAELKRLHLLTANNDKIAQVISVLTAGFKEKFLYDLVLSPEVVEPTEEMQQMKELMGGQERLLYYFRVYPYLEMVSSIFALRDINCLNPVNFERLIALGRDNSISPACVNSVIIQLSNNNLFNEANFNLALAHKKHASVLANGMVDLKIAGLLNQASFEELLRCEENAETAGSALRILQEHHLMNLTNRKTVLRMARAATDIDLLLPPLLSKLQAQNLLTLEDGLILQWNSDRQELQGLCERIDEMFAYGLFLLSCDEEKATTVFSLAIALKKSLKTFFEKPIEEQQAQQQQFKADFLQLLHSQDKALAEHRAYWKVIVANVALAFTGVGLLALGGYYLATGHCFFHQTHRENLRDKIEKSPWLQQDQAIAINSVV